MLTANLGSDRDWAFHTRPNPLLSGRSLLWSMGKVLGGGSSILTAGVASCYGLACCSRPVVSSCGLRFAPVGLSCLDFSSALGFSALVASLILAFRASFISPLQALRAA
ncbi:MAG: GMC family oxidoreductase N-terminal domain-containing protein [Acidobacteriaceae bacterium]|nr:GMC family oxidoreductase N-terminal domain-containing protein [Acidobacteriaceae bacterium]